jgi:hypothetical protein
MDAGDQGSKDFTGLEKVIASEAKQSSKMANSE